MKYKVDEQIPAGAQVRVEVEWDKTIKKVRITGDFLAHPESVIESIEESLVGLPSAAWESSLLARINSAVDDSKATLIGISAWDIARLVKRAVS
jgi:hypothetical protein